MTTRLLALLALLFAIPILAAARRERTAIPAAAGPNRLSIDATLLEGATPLRYRGVTFEAGLENLRLRDANGNEVPYVLVPPKPVREIWYTGRLISTPATKKESGFEVDLGASRRVDAVRIDGLPTPYLKRMRIEASGDRGHWVTAVADGTLFDLPGEGLASTKAVFAPGDYRYLRLTWDDRASARVPLPHHVEARDARRAAPPPELFDAAFARRPSEPRNSRFRISLPASYLPIIALVLDCDEKTLLRGATVDEIRLGENEASPTRLGSATLRRVESEGAVAARLRIPIDSPHGPDLELVIDDGDNPPFRLTSVRVELPPLPWLYFESADGEPITARWGDASLPAPRYDAAARIGSLDLSAVPAARWAPGAVRVARESSTPASALEGAAIDLSSFRFARAIPAMAPGLASLLVDAPALAHSNRQVDLRIVNRSGRQIPYVVEHRNEPLEIPLEIPEREDAGKGLSRYEIELPFDTLPDGARLVVTTEGRVFERDVTVRAMRERPGERVPRTLASTRWRALDVAANPSLDLTLPVHGLASIALEIDEGDNAPLVLTSARLLVPMIRLRFMHSGGGGLVLAYGNAKAAAPRYDLALLAPRLFGEIAKEIIPGNEPDRTDSTGETSRTVFWIAIIASALVLMVLIARMLKGDGA